MSGEQRCWKASLSLPSSAYILPHDSEVTSVEVVLGYCFAWGWLKTAGLRPSTSVGAEHSLAGSSAQALTQLLPRCQATGVDFHLRATEAVSAPRVTQVVGRIHSDLQVEGCLLV